MALALLRVPPVDTDRAQVPRLAVAVTVLWLVVTGAFLVALQVERVRAAQTLRLTLAIPAFGQMTSSESANAREIAAACDLVGVAMTKRAVVECLHRGAAALDRRDGPDGHWEPLLAHMLVRSPQAASPLFPSENP